MQKQDNVAIITGASRGIGFAIASELAGMGFHLGMVSRSKSDIEKASQKIVEQFPDTKVFASAFDVTDESRTKEFVQHVTDKLGIVSVLVNNAGNYLTGTSNMPLNELQQLMDVNFLAAARFVQSVLPSMKKIGSGYIINIASVCGVEAYADVGSYCASKFALVGYSSSLTQELAPFGIKVTAICPSWVNTKIAEISNLKPEDMIQPDDIAASVRYLLGLGKHASVRELVIHCN